MGDRYTRYVQVEVGFPRSKLVDRARGDLGLTTNEAIGTLVRLWLAVMQTRDRGSLAGRSDAWIEEEVGWRGETGAFARFVRTHHLDESGVIRDWLTKYGKLDATREKTRTIKAAQRQRLLGPGKRPPDEGVDSPVDTAVDEGVDVHRDNGRSVSSSSSLSVRHQEQQQPVSQQEPVGRERDPLTATLAEAGLDLSGFEPADRAVIEGALRGSRSPLARAVVLANHLSGANDQPQYTPAIVGRAFREYMASEQPWSSRLFGGFIRDAAKQAQVGANRVRATNERQHIDREAIDAENARREEAEVNELLADFERAHGDEYLTLQVQADKLVPAQVRGAFRQPMIKAQLVKLIRARNNGAH